MNRRRLFQLGCTGDEVPAELISSVKLASVPAAVADYVKAFQYGGPTNMTILKLSSLVSACPKVNTSYVGVSTKILSFPQGLIAIQGVLVDLALTTNLGATATVNAALGSAAVTTASTVGTLLTTTQNVVKSNALTFSASAADFHASSAMAALTDSSGGTADGTIEACADLNTSNTYADSAINAKLAILRNWAADFASKINQLMGRNTLLDGTTTAADLYLSFGDADDTGGTDKIITASGTVKLLWQFLGDY